MKRKQGVAAEKPKPSWGLDKIGKLPKDPKEREQMLQFWLEVLNFRTINLELQVDALWRMVTGDRTIGNPERNNTSHFSTKVRILGGRTNGKSKTKGA